MIDIDDHRNLFVTKRGDALVRFEKLTAYILMFHRKTNLSRVYLWHRDFEWLENTLEIAELDTTHGISFGNITLLDYGEDQ